MNQKEHFLYERRYRSFKEVITDKSDDIKARIQQTMAKNKFLSKYLDPFDLYYVNKRENIERIKLRTFGEANEETVCDDISLKEVNYFEALEIDDFDKYKNRLVSKFHKHQSFISPDDKEKLKQTLSEVKEQFNSISWGGLSYLNFSKKTAKSHDLFSTVTVSYIKTYESYFILKIKVKPSEKFNKIFKKIVSQTDVGASVRRYNSYRNIIRTKKFSNGESIIMSLKSDNISNLLSDLNYQIKQNLTKHFSGYFHAIKVSPVLPSIEHYEVPSMANFDKDADLKRKFETNLNEHYLIPDKGINIYMPDSSYHKRTLIKIVKETGHGKRQASEHNLTDYDWLETKSLIDSLSFPCVFQGILEGQFNKLNKLKREIYDFVRDTNKSSFYNSFFFFMNNRRYAKLKQTLTQIGHRFVL